MAAEPRCRARGTVATPTACPDAAKGQTRRGLTIADVKQSRAHIGTLSGIALTPGDSRNGRRYTRENIGKAVARLNSKIQRGEVVTLMTHHGAAEMDDPSRVIGRLTSARQTDNGSLAYEAALADTSAARDLAALSRHGYVRSQSIRGRWVGPVQKVAEGSTTLDTADDIDITGLDYTLSPGVEGAGVSSVQLAESLSAHGLFLESADVRVEVTEALPEARLVLALAPEDDDEMGPSLHPEETNVTETAAVEATETVAEAATEHDLAAIIREGFAALRQEIADSKEKASAAEPVTEAVTEPVAESGISESVRDAITVAVNAAVDARLAELKESAIKDVVKAHGVPSRKGLIAEAEAKPLHEMSTTELREAAAANATEVLRKWGVA